MTEPHVTATSRAHDAALAAATEALLNCYMREGGTWEAVPACDARGLARPGDTHLAVLSFRDPSTTLLVGIRHLSPTQRHRFRLPAMVAVDGGEPAVVPLYAVAAMLVSELAATADPGVSDPDPNGLLARIPSSCATARSTPCGARIRRASSRPSRRCCSATCCTRRRRAAAR
jgi:siderophore synthetase component